MLPYAVIGAGPMGLCTARRLKQEGIAFTGFEIHSDVGGLWDIDSPTSTMYHSAHLISSKTMTEFKEFPMPPGTPDYPRHDLMKSYFRGYAEKFRLYEEYQFQTKVIRAEPKENGWELTVDKGDGKARHIPVRGILLANGTLHKPRRITLPGAFSGIRLHSAEYKDADLFKKKRVLIIGCGNSACDIAVDAVHAADRVDMVVRRGYHFLPKFVMGRPIDTLGGRIRLPARLKQLVDGMIVKLLIGRPSSFGLPDPSYRLYESHPVVNSLVLHHLGHGDIRVRPGLKTVADRTVTFEDDTIAEYDLILEATGYELDYGIVNSSLLNWKGAAPDLYLNVFHPDRDDLFIMGMVEAAGLGWQGRDDQARMVALYLAGLEKGTKAARRLQQIKKQRAGTTFDGGMNYLKLDRMAYYVNKEAYLKAVRGQIQALEAGL